MVSDIYVSTDGEEIARVAENYGAKVIWRPKETATDVASSETAIIHAVSEIEKEYPSQIYIFLQTTSPLRRGFDIDNAINTLIKGNYDSVFSMAVLDDYCIWKRDGKQLMSYSYDYRNRGRRQERENLFLENGSIYVFRKELLLCEKNRIGGKIGMYEMPFECSYEIDTEKDIFLCEYFMKQILENEKKGVC